MNSEGAEASNLPKYALKDSKVQEAYEYVAENPEFLEYIPCYCNYYRLVHKNIKKYFMSKFKTNGNLFFEAHGADYAICYHAVLDSKNLFQRRKSVKKIEILLIINILNMEWGPTHQSHRFQ